MYICDFLKSLGSTADEVADSLRKQGVKGKKGSPCYCPILNAIYTALPDYWSGLEIVNGTKIGDSWHYCATLRDAQIMDPRLPQPVMDFIRKFDCGEYPDLEATVVKEVVTRTRVWS